MALAAQHFADDTIVALATPQGPGALAVIRLSGPSAIGIADGLFVPKGKKRLAEVKSHTVHFGEMHEGDEVIDEVLTTVFRGPRSYTGEDVVEVSCHGSEYVRQRLMTAFIGHGARLARPGEFTQRAFMNGRLNLVQAEAVADLIASETAAQHRVAMSQMRGGYVQALSELRQQLIDFVALLELELDFSEEDVEFADRSRLLSLLDSADMRIGGLMASFRDGNAIKSGIPIVIAGRPNAGKSTLLNALLNEDRAIVSPIAGTTRDVIEDQLVIDGIPFRIMDTAGLRQSDDLVEQAGIERSYVQMGKGTLVIYLYDPGTTTPDEVGHDLRELTAINPNILAVANKSDLMDVGADKSTDVIRISAKNLDGIDHLRLAMVRKAVNSANIGTGSVTLSNLRHYEALEKAHQHLQAARQGLASGVSGEFVTHDLRRVLEHIGEITGEVTTEDLLGSIFSRFCIGK
jgi:tRNA modification GTPase